MRPGPGLAMLVGLLAVSTACLAARPDGQSAPAPVQRPSSASAAPMTRGRIAVCVIADSADPLTREFSLRLRETVASSGSFRLAHARESCALRLHVPGNLLRFETAGAVMVSTVVVVTSSSGRYLSTSITACRARALNPCASRAVAVAKLALMVSSRRPS
jgi:hypothetical protein